MWGNCVANWPSTVSARCKTRLSTSSCINDFSGITLGEAMWFIHWCSCAAMKDIFQMKAPRSSSFLCDVHDAMFWQPGMSSINILSHLSFFQADQRVCPVLRILWTASVYPDIQMPTAISGLWFMETQCWPKKKKSDRLALATAVVIHYVILPTFSIIMPQFEDGHSPSSGNLQTIISIWGFTPFSWLW